jgi:hypothetical protein
MQGIVTCEICGLKEVCPLGSKADICAAKSDVALHPIATAKADTPERVMSRGRLRRTFVCRLRVKKRSHAAQQTAARLFDHLIGLCEQRGRHGKAERLGGLEIYHQLELGRLFNRQITRFRAF